MGVTWAVKPVGVSTLPFGECEQGSEPLGFRVYGRITSRLMQLFAADDPGWTEGPDEEGEVSGAEH